MDRSLYVAMTAASANLRRQATVSHNLANASTPGFKATMNGTVAVPVQGPGFDSRVAASVRTFGVDATQGGFMQTGNPLDIALADGNWLVVQDTAGGQAYTRGGDLKVNANGQLLTGAGRPVLDSDGNAMAIPPYQSIMIATDGTVSIVPEGENGANQVNVGRIATVTGAVHDLDRGEDGLMRTRAGAQPLPQSEGRSVFSGTLESSNADAATALVDMIEIARQYELAVKVLEKGDENARTSNSMLTSR